jgi:reticulon-4-interacting protein 1, mitochondrial
MTEQEPVALSPSSLAPLTMRAWTHTRRGDPCTVLTLSTIPRPNITRPTDVLVRITHAALNNGASILTQLIPFIFRTSPSVPELDFAGTVVETGSDVAAARGLDAGSPVFGCVSGDLAIRAGMGALAEYVVVSASCVTQKPANASFEEAAGLGIAGITALQLVKKARLEKGAKVLVNGASGGVGTLLVQIVRETVGPSGKVIATCSGKNADLVKTFGTDEVSDPISTSMVLLGIGIVCVSLERLLFYVPGVAL